MRKIFTFLFAALMSVSMFGTTVTEDISMDAANWTWGYGSAVVADGNMLKCILTSEWGAMAIGWNEPTRDLSDWDRIVIVVENMNGCDGEWFKLKAYLRDFVNKDSEQGQMEATLGLDAEDNQQHYMVINLKEEGKNVNLTACGVLGIQCQPNGAEFKISRVYLEKESAPVDYPYPIRHAGEVDYPYLKVGDRIAEGAEIKGNDNLKLIFKAARHKSSGNLASADNEVLVGELSAFGVNGLISGGFGEITPINAAGKAGIEWEVVSVGSLGTGPLELVGVGYPYPLNYVDTVKCLDVKAGDSISVGAVLTGVGYIRFIGGTYKKNGVLQSEDSEVMEIVDYPYVGYPYCSEIGKIVIGEDEFTSCDPAGNNLSQWLCYETGPLSTGPLGTGPLGTGPLALKGTGPLAPATYTLQLVADPEKGSVAVTNLLGSDIIDNGNGNYTVPANAEVTILATPLEGYEFSGWKVGNRWCDFTDCGTALNTLDNPMTITMTKDVAYKAEFKAKGEGIENIVLTEKAQKVVVDGVLYIVRDGKLYNALGAEVK